MTTQPPTNDDVSKPDAEEELPEPKQSISELETIRQECEKYKAGWMRAQADYQNLQKETEARRSEFVRMCEAQILEEFIPVYTNFKTAFSHAPKNEGDGDKNWQNWSTGIGFIMKQFGDILKQHDVEEIKTVGEIFNPVLHEAVSEEESEMPEHTIIREVEAGYMMKGKVLKVAKVVVSKVG